MSPELWIEISRVFDPARVLPASGYRAGDPDSAQGGARRSTGRWWLEPDSAEAHTACGLVAYELKWNKTRAKQEFDKAIQLNPNYTHGIHWHAHFLENENRFTEAEQEMAASSGDRSDVAPLDA